MSTIKITQKGQITIPANFRKNLKQILSKWIWKGKKHYKDPLENLGVFNKYAIKSKPIEDVALKEK